jgi:transketolase
MREALVTALIQAAQADERIILLTGDHGYSLFDRFRSACPKQFLNAGVAEQNMVGVAAGLAKSGLRPVVYGLSAFVPVRVLEQIKLDVCYERLPVLFIGDGAGVVYSALGPSHQSAEDVAGLRALPNMAILSPADAPEMTACMDLALRAGWPVYLRVGKADLDPVHEGLPSVRWGRLTRLRHGAGKLGWIATGSMVRTALNLASAWPGSPVWSAPCIKPLLGKPVARICQRQTALVVLEEHSVLGGLGSAIAEISTSHCPTWILRVGIRDRFSQKCGSYAYLRKEHEIDEASISARVCSFLESLPARARREISDWNADREASRRQAQTSSRLGGERL